MKSCIYCGNPLEDQAQFCNVCGQNQQPQYQQPQYQAPQYQAPQYQAPQYQQPQYQAPQYQVPYAPAAAYPASPGFLPPVNTVGLFNLIGAITTTVLGYLLNLILPGIVGGWFYNTILPWIWSATYIVITGIGFFAYNDKCVQLGHPEKKLSLGWLFLIWVIREAFSFVFGFIWGLCTTAIFNSGIPMRTLSIIFIVVNLIINLGSALLTWPVSNAILKSVVKNK